MGQLTSVAYCASPLAAPALLAENGKRVWTEVEVVGQAKHHLLSVASWPGVIKAGQVSNALVSTLDYLPTMPSLSRVSHCPQTEFTTAVDLANLLLRLASIPTERIATKAV